MRSKLMKDRLAENLWSFIKVNNPDLSHQLEESDGEAAYLNSRLDTVYTYYEQLTDAGRPDHVIEELCLSRLTADLKPSRFKYLSCVLKDEFPRIYNGWYQDGWLTEQTIRLTRFCKPVFDLFGLRSQEPYYDRIYYAVTAQIQLYLKDKGEHCNYL